MSPTEQDRIDDIERDRRKRERELLALLLLLCGGAEESAIHALSLGIDPAAAAMVAIQGIGAPPGTNLARMMSERMGDIYAMAGRRVRGWAGLPKKLIGPAQAVEIAIQYSTFGSNVSIGIAKRIGQTIAGGLAVSPESDKAAVISRAVADAGMSHENSSHLQLVADLSTLRSYNDGMFAAYFDPDTAGMILGFRHQSVLDERTTKICDERAGLSLRPHDPYWLKNWPSLHFNAIAQGARVTTQGGEKSIEDIQVGDLVLTHRGRFMPVTAVMSKDFRGNIRSFNLDSGRILRTTDEHPVCLASRGWLRADAINSGDKLFQHAKQPVQGTSPIFHRIPEYDPSIFNEVFIPDKVTFDMFGFLMTLAVNLKGNLIRERDIQNVRPNRLLEFVFNAGKHVQNLLLSPTRFRPLAVGVGLTHFDPSGRISRRVGGTHTLRILGSPYTRGFRFEPFPLGGMNNRDLFFCRNRRRLNSRPNLDSVPFADGIQGGFGKSIFSLKGTDRDVKPKVFSTDNLSDLFNGWNHAAIISIADKNETCRVYNLSVAEDETYVTEGIVVHNCRSVVLPVFRGESFAESTWRPETPPMQGFGLAPEWVQRLREVA